MNIKKSIWGIPVLFSLLFSACEQEQTALNIDAISGQALVKGRVMYKSGEVQANGYVNAIWTPAEGQTVYAYLSNADLTGNVAAAGETSYTTKVDTNGDYTLTLPATLAGVAVRLEFSNFDGTYSVFDGINTSGALQYKSQEGFFQTGAIALTIKNAMSYIRDCDTYAFTARTVLTVGETVTTDFVKVSGQITYTAESRSADSLTVSNVKRAAIGQTVLIRKGSSYYSSIAQSKPVGESNLAVYEVYLPVNGTSEVATIFLDLVTYEGTYLDYILTSGKYSTSKILKGKYEFDGWNGTQVVTLEKGFPSYITSILNYTFTAYPDYAQ